MPQDFKASFCLPWTSGLVCAADFGQCVVCRKRFCKFCSAHVADLVDVEVDLRRTETHKQIAFALSYHGHYASPLRGVVTRLVSLRVCEERSRPW